MNLCRGILGVIFLACTFLFTGIHPVDPRSFALLAVSGVLGISIGDTLFFQTLRNLGPRLTALMGTMVPVITALAAVIFLGERPGLMAWLGIMLTACGVGWLLWEKDHSTGMAIKNRRTGIRDGILFIIASTLGVILTKMGVKITDALSATFIRILSGVVGLVCWGALTSRLKEGVSLFNTPSLLKKFIPIVFIGVFGGFLLFIISLQYIDASIASTLNSTSALFILPMAALIGKEKISWRAVAGACVAVIGVGLILLNHGG